MMTLPIRILPVLALALLWIQASLVLGQSLPFFQEDFDSVTPPALPFGWQDPLAEWATSSSVGSSGSGGNNLTIAGSQSASVQTPVFNLTGLTSGTIEYLARRTSTYPQDSLVVLASIDGGASFSITLLDLGEALPASDGSYDLISMAVPGSLLGQADVVLQFIALGGTTSGSNIRIDDVLISGDGDPSAGNSVFGFSTLTSALDQATGIAEVPVFLDFEDVTSLQGLQLDVSWDVPELAVNAIVPGTAIANTADWSLSFNQESAQLTAVLLGNDGASVGQGLYDPLFTLQFVLPSTSSSMEANLMIDAVIGSLAVPTGDDAGLLIGQQSHTITLDPGDAVFSPDATELDAGQVSVGTTGDVTLTVSNTGNTDLVISDVTISNALFSLAPTTATVAPGSSQAFLISYTPAFEAFGFQNTTLTFLHNAEGGSTAISVSGTGTGGRGDASQDGVVDVLDLILGVDYVLGVSLPDPVQSTSVDLFPFESPDGALDVRDLTVLSQAILLDIWPDGVSLPPASQGAIQSGKSDLSPAFIQPLVSESASTLVLSTDVPVRAVQFVIEMDAPIEEPVIPGDLSPGLTVQWAYDAWGGVLRVLAVRMDGGSLEDGLHALLKLPGTTGRDPMQLESGVVILEGPEPMELAWLDAAPLLSEGNEGSERNTVGAPYPNPFVVTHGQHLQIPLTLLESQDVQGYVFDLLGRRVAELQRRTLERGDHLLSWNGQDHQNQQVAAGLYLLKVSTSTHAVTRLVTVY